MSSTQQLQENAPETDDDPPPPLPAETKNKRRRFRFRWYRRKCYHQPDLEDGWSAPAATPARFGESNPLDGDSIPAEFSLSVSSESPSLAEPSNNSAPQSKQQLLHQRRSCHLCRCCCDLSGLFRLGRRLLSFGLSTVGLNVVVFFYTLLGGVVFHFIESPNEVRTKHGVEQSRRWHVDRLWNVTEALNVLHPANWSLMAEEIVANYTRVVYLATKVDGWDGKQEGDAELQWSVAGSVLYAATVITTIGYGHITPKTPLGRLVTIVYAIVGIPLTLLSITHLGGFLATVFRFLYKNLVRGVFCTPVRGCRDRRRCNRTEPAITATAEEEEPNETVVELRKASSVAAENNSSKPETTGLLVTRNNIVNGLNKSYRLVLRWRRGIRNALYDVDNKSINVPIYVSLGLIGGYLALGALMFGLWEPEWNFLIGCYFCFITLSTIGFGDFVPGTSLDPSAAQQKLVLCSLYLVFGLALLAMCFDLIQEEARNIFRTLGRKLRLVPTDNRVPEVELQEQQE